MVWARVLLCPILILGAQRNWNGKTLGLIVLVALVDDIYDGILARRWQCETENLRRADSAADTVFYLGVAAALWIREENLLRHHWTLLAILGALEITRHGFDRWKFGKGAAYHSYLAKIWGLIMGIAVIGVLSFDGPRWLLPISLLLGIASDLEGLAMSLILPRWKNDVKSIPAAWRMRQAMLRATASSA